MPSGKIDRWLVFGEIGILLLAGMMVALSLLLMNGDFFEDRPQLESFVFWLSMAAGLLAVLVAQCIVHRCDAYMRDSGRFSKAQRRRWRLVIRFVPFGVHLFWKKYVETGVPGDAASRDAGEAGAQLGAAERADANSDRPGPADQPDV